MWVSELPQISGGHRGCVGDSARVVLGSRGLQMGGLSRAIEGAVVGFVDCRPGTSGTTVLCCPLWGVQKAFGNLSFSGLQVTQIRSRLLDLHKLVRF